jgi:hypothetical protein
VAAVTPREAGEIGKSPRTRNRRICSSVGFLREKEQENRKKEKK